MAISETATVMHRENVDDTTAIGDRAWVGDRARVTGFAFIGPRTIIFGDAHVTGHARVGSGAEIEGHAFIGGRSHIRPQARIKGNAQIEERGDYIGAQGLYGWDAYRDDKCGIALRYGCCLDPLAKWADPVFRAEQCEFHDRSAVDDLDRVVRTVHAFFDIPYANGKAQVPLADYAWKGDVK